MSQSTALCPVWMPAGWEVCPRTEISSEGWITGRPRKSRMRNLLPSQGAQWEGHLDEESLLSARPYLAIALLRRHLGLAA